ncbi:hypothetical protein VMC01_141 [Klebsiella phage ValerieMcCarty01]|nr:hypothetical protein BOBOTO_125 [Klebsiella phage vB_KaeM_Boboto]WPH67888.1 hypothetical protein VMC01_141 [Klebsiella phage ValerieMcCarty01]
MFSVEIGRHGDGHLLSSHIASYAGDGGKSLTESVVQVQVLPEQSRGIAQLDRAADF